MEAGILHAKSVVVLLAALVILPTALGGCRLIYPPAEDAVEQTLDTIACLDRGDQDDLIDDADLRADMHELCVAFGGAVYRGAKNYWTIEEIEVDKAEDMTYVWVTVEVPFPKRSKFVEVVFHMRRDFINWKILEVEGIGALLRTIDKAKAYAF